MNCVLALVFPSLVLLLRTISGGKETRNETSCPEGTFVHSNQDNTLTFFTDNTANYDKVWFKPKRSRLPVMVKASKDAHFKLQTSNSSVAYEIVLGAYENARSDIRLSGSALVQTFTVGVLRPNEYVPFVIAWNSSRIVVVRGTDESDIVVEWTNPSNNIVVSWIGLTGYKLQIQGGDNDYEEYQFKETEVSSFWVKTPALSPYKRFQRTLYNVDGQRFELTTAGEATIAFLASPDKNFSQPTYRLTIGALNNTQTILYYRSNKILVSNSTPGILSSAERRRFWVAWKDGRFAFGLGWKFYENSTLISPDSTIVEKFHSMAVDSTHEAEWNFSTEDSSCVATCQEGWYLNWASGNCQRCSMSVSNCFSCTKDQSSDRPVCTSCTNGTLMLGEGGECLSECPPNVGYTSDYDQRKCACSYGHCCGPVAFRFCFIVVPCLLGILLLASCLMFAIRKLRRMYFIDPQRIDVDQLSKILSLVPAHVVESIYVENVRNRQESLGPNDVDVPMATLLARDPGETPFSRDF